MQDGSIQIPEMQYATNKSMDIARQFIQEELPYQFSEIEESILKCFFSNLRNRVVFIKNLPPGVSATLISMFSRMENPRGIRGVFLDSFLPSILASKLNEPTPNIQISAEAQPQKSKTVKNIDEFSSLSNRASLLLFAFTHAYQEQSSYQELFANSQKAKKFIKTWLDQYGHNSIGRMAGITFCVEGCSMLCAKSIEWGRPGIGYVELSSRYVNLQNARCYPISQELWSLKYKAEEVSNMINNLFASYRLMQGENQNGYLPTFLREKYKSIFKDEEEKKLQQGIFGECCDLGGNFLPLSTLTSVGIQTSGESFSNLLKHLLLDATSENIALVEQIKTEATKVGVDQFFGHYEPSEKERAEWRYLNSRNNGVDLTYNLPPEQWASKMLRHCFSMTGLPKNLNEIAKILYQQDQRIPQSFRKLPPEFENISAFFSGKISMRSWRDIQRMGYSTHNRSLVTPYIGFYQYEKPAPEQLSIDFQGAYNQSKSVYNRLKNNGASQNVLQYILPMGCLVNFSYGCNLRQLEFSIWQRTKPSVNHEVRSIFIKMEQAIQKTYPWWQLFSRCNTTRTYLFARGDSCIPIEIT